MDADQGWEEAALNTRHIHNRNDRGGQGNTRESFQIRQTFGTHLVKCPALERLQTTQPGGASSSSSINSSKARGKSPAKQQQQAGKKKAGRSNSGSGEVVLDIYRLADDENGILGSLKFPGVFEASVVLAGSRKILGSITRDLGRDDSAAEEPPYGGDRRGSSTSSGSQARKALNLPNGAGSTEDGETGVDDEDEEDDDDEDDEEYSGEDDGLNSQERRQRRRVATFEKNSFRQPKFWFRWQGVVSDDALNETELELEGGKVHGSGYLVFSGNDCRRFQGTMTSENLGWNNVKMTGWKAKPQPERDFEIQWTREA